MQSKMQELVALLGPDVVGVKDEVILTPKGEIRCRVSGKVVLRYASGAEEVLGTLDDLYWVNYEYTNL